MKRRVLFILVIVIVIDIFSTSPYPVFAQDAWKVYKTNCCTIKYLNEKSMKVFTRRIGGIKLTRKGLNKNLNVKVDMIMEKVQAILDMYPFDLQISIILYPDYKSLKKIFRQFSPTGNPPISFYAHKIKSIYIAVDSVTDGVLAHEMAHAVISVYFEVPPPAKMQEILAQYVDLHLWD